MTPPPPRKVLASYFQSLNVTQPTTDRPPIPLAYPLLNNGAISHFRFFGTHPYSLEMKMTFDKTIKVAALCAAFAMLASGCGTEEAETLAPQKADDTGAAAEKLADGKADAWNSRNNPDGLRVEMTKTLADLPMNGEPENRAWPDTYWPTYMDSTNHRWQTTGNFLDDLSPMEKYDVVFNGWDPTAVQDLRPFDGKNCAEDSFDPTYYEKLGPGAKYVSANMGNKSTREAVLAGELETSCNAKADSECVKACDDVPEEDQSRCKDRCDRGGVETWWGLCHAWAPAAILEKEPLHPVTMPTEFGDITFEIGDIKALYSVMYNRSSAALIGGRCNDLEVKRDETTGRIVNDDCRDLNAGSFHVAMANLVGIQKRGFVEDRTYDYEVWNQPVKGYDVHEMTEISVEEAHELLKVDVENPTDCITGVDVANGDYCYQAGIDQLFKVSTSLHWITESHASTVAEGVENLARYSRTDRYTYILEVRDGEIVGGEWYGSSIQNHPDFIWLPFRAASYNPALNVEKVRLLGNKSQIDPTAVPAGPVSDMITVESGALATAIPDKDLTGISSSLEVGDGVEVASAKVYLDITHTYIGDLVITLNGPGGQVHELHNKQGGSQDDIKKSFEITPAGAIAGTWTLKVVDTYARDLGTLNSWKIDFSVAGADSPAPGQVVEAVSDIVAEIPDNLADGITSYVTVEQSGSIKKMELELDISHTYVGDLEITLSKGGVSKVVHNREGGSSDDLKKTFPLDEFNGQEASGR